MIRRNRLKSSRLRVAAHSGRWISWKWALVGLTAVLLLFLFLSGPQGTVRLVQLLMERKHLSQELTELQKENQSIETAIERFRSDPNAVEEEAREKLGFVKKGEVIYRFSQPSKSRP